MKPTIVCKGYYEKCWCFFSLLKVLVMTKETFGVAELVMRFHLRSLRIVELVQEFHLWSLEVVELVLELHHKNLRVTRLVLRPEDMHFYIYIN